MTRLAGPIGPTTLQAVSDRLRPAPTARRIALAVTAAAMLAACGGSDDDENATTVNQGPVLDTKVVALAITDSIREQRDATAEVVCPENVKQAKGVSFVCVATSRHGRTEFVVTQKDDAGNVDYVAADDEGAEGTAVDTETPGDGNAEDDAAE